jgi:hypothetical protein
MAWSGLTVCSPEEGLFFASDFYPCNNLAFLSLSLSCYAESQGDETLALGDGTSLPLAMKLLFQRI